MNEMAPVFNQGKRVGEGILSEAKGTRSRDQLVIASGSGIIKPMTVLGLYTSGGNSGKWGPAPATGATGHDVARAVCLDGGDATSADIKVAALTRDCEVIGTALSYDASVDTAPEIAAKATQLAAVGIIIR
jgi:hypothetical protein